MLVTVLKNNEWDRVFCSNSGKEGPNDRKLASALLLSVIFVKMAFLVFYSAFSYKNQQKSKTVSI